jgi:hypothetical protein
MAASATGLQLLTKVTISMQGLISCSCCAPVKEQDSCDGRLAAIKGNPSVCSALLAVPAVRQSRSKTAVMAAKLLSKVTVSQYAEASGKNMMLLSLLPVARNTLFSCHLIVFS